MLNLNERGGEGRTHLMRACARGDTGLVRFLLQNGASPHLRDDSGLTAVEIAHIHGHVEVAKLLASWIVGDTGITENQ